MGSWTFRRACFLVLVALAMPLANANSASVVAKYEFSTTLVSTDTDLTSTAGALGNVGLGATTFNALVGNPFPSLQDAASDITMSTGVAPNNTSTDYYTFMVTPNPGTSLTYTTLTLDAATLDLSVNNNSFFIGLETSANSFVNLGSFTINNNTTFQNISFDLSSLPAQTTATEFRVTIRTNSTSASRGILLDNLIANANVNFIPEPSTWAMMMMGAALLLGGERLRRLIP